MNTSFITFEVAELHRAQLMAEADTRRLLKEVRSAARAGSRSDSGSHSRSDSPDRKGRRFGWKTSAAVARRETPAT